MVHRDISGGALSARGSKYKETVMSWSIWEAGVSGMRYWSLHGWVYCGKCNSSVMRNSSVMLTVRHRIMVISAGRVNMSDPIPGKPIAPPSPLMIFPLLSAVLPLVVVALFLGPTHKQYMMPPDTDGGQTTAHAL